MGHRALEQDARLDSRLPGSIEETADAVDSAGGTGVPFVCDHTAGEYEYGITLN